MATSQQQLVCDSSTLANFKQWAQAISGVFTTFGWTQSSDTGQVNWSTISSPPAASAYVYEIWQPNDGLTNFYLKVEYGNTGTAAQPSIRLTISTSTNGAGTATGFVLGPVITAPSAFTVPSTTAQFECDFSGAAGRIAVMMWRNATTGGQQLFAVERSVNSSGAYTSNYVTLWTIGVCNGGSGVNQNISQRSLVFAVGAATNLPNNVSNSVGGLAVRFVLVSNGAGNTGGFNNSIPFDTAAPVVGYFDYPCTVIGVAAAGDVAEGVTFTVTLYGSTRTYMPSKNGALASSPYNLSQFNSAICMRYD